jgi:hypothetical protein
MKGLFFYGCKTWSLTVSEKHEVGMRVGFREEYICLRGEKQQVSEEKYVMSCIVCISGHMLLGLSRRTRWLDHVPRMVK